jgi:signal transduction histidine kinase
MSPASSEQFPADSDKAERIMALVNKAAALIDGQGKSVFAEFRKADSAWRTGDTYLFVNDMKGMSLLNAVFPILEGHDVSGLKDPNGKLVTVELMKTAQSKGSGWVDYMAPKPGERQLSQKWSYVKAVTIDGIPGYVGAGFYPQ